MEIDMNINDILQVLREMITFLECLGDAQLPLTLESLREKLLVRSKNTLSVTMARASSLAEPYLDMKSGPRSVLLTKSEADSEEYVGMEESQKRTQIHPRTHTHQDYYETFENDGSLRIASASSITNEYLKQNDDRDEGGQMLIGIYKNVSAMQIKSKCYKCGPLYRKEGKKLFLSESRACWIALVGSHLLIYRSERHNRPYAIYQIRGYRARPAPMMIPRDRQKSESAFEIYSPGNETLQFIARTPKEMDQWIAKICEIECCNESERKKATEAHEKKGRTTIVESPLTDHSRSNKTTRDAEKSVVVDNSTAKAAELTSNRNKVERKENTDERAPSLPARIPRRLPSLPPDNEILTVSSYRATVDGDDDDDDDIYHRIEDLRNETRYQNMILPKDKQAGASDEKQKEERAIAYDDIGARNKKNERNDQVEKDATRIEPKRNLDNDSSIESLIPHGRFAKDRVKIETSSKLQQKKSFLDRVLSRRESPKSKESDKRERYRYKEREDKVSSNPASSLDMEKMPTYDDVSDLTSKQDYQAGSLTDEDEELSEYNHPPPPRPIYQVKLLAEGQSETQEFYDDVSAYQERHNKNPQQATRDSCSTKVNEAERNATYDTDQSETNAREETEHYQSPRSDLCIRDDADEKNEQLYDDIALWADFTARQRDIAGKRETEDAKSVSLDKKAWNRFAVNRKSRVTSDFNCSTEPNKRGDNEGSDEIEDSPTENSGAIKRNTFQKLISRMENSLAKVSARSPSSLSTGKSSVSSNSS
ncbi:DNA ligase 1 isoform X2 [Mycetomoellerius zeteki]|uniref:DNA ligase 1 isoform X2 n=1 Tax=Mycetomoellerius zeteki TaxID=64791 RepID=UPI00084E95D2|nr:PREDICTED: DNA ligase 1-like isoform X2 [Trachymyrmex zeteki]